MHLCTLGSVVCSLQKPYITLRCYCERLYRCEQESSLFIFLTKCNYGIGIQDYELLKRKTRKNANTSNAKWEITWIVGVSKMLDSEIRRQIEWNSSNGWFIAMSVTDFLGPINLTNKIHPSNRKNINYKDSRGLSIFVRNTHKNLSLQMPRNFDP